MSLSSYCGPDKLESFADVDCQLITILFNEYLVYFTTYFNRVEYKISHLGAYSIPLTQSFNTHVFP